MLHPCEEVAEDSTNRSGAVRRTGNRANLIRAFVVAGLIIGFGILYVKLGMSLSKANAFKTYDVVFGADPNRVIPDIAVPSAYHGRTNVHPLFILLVNPIGTLATYIFQNTVRGAGFVNAAAGAAAVATLFVYLLRLGLRLTEALLLSLIYGFSMSHLIFSATPETFAFGALTLIAAHLAFLLAAQGWRGAYLLQPVTALLTLAMTVTNYAQPLILFGLTALKLIKRDEPIVMNRRLTPWRWFMGSVVASLAIAIVLSRVQLAIYPTASVFYNPRGMAGELKFMRFGSLSSYDVVKKVPGLSRLIAAVTRTDVQNVEKLASQAYPPRSSLKETVMSVALGFGPYSIIGPEPDKVSYWVQYSTASVRRYTWFAIAGLTAGGALLLQGLWVGWKEHRLVLAGFLLGLAANGLLHSFYGNQEVFLYSAHTTFLIMGIMGLGFTGPLKPAVQRWVGAGCLALLCVVTVTNNLHVMFWTIDYIRTLRI